MKDLTKDPWIQILGVLAMVSGLVALIRQVPGASAGPAPAVAVPAAPAPFVPAPAPAAREGASELSAPPMLRSLRARRPGNWVVDQARGEGADTDLIAEALHNAASGDQILIRPGRYRENLRISRDVALMGDGDRPGDAVIDGGEGVAVEIHSAEVVLRRLTFSSSEMGARAEGGALNAFDCRWEGGGGLSAEGGAFLKLSGGVFERAEEAVSALGSGTRAELSGVKIQGGKNGLSVSGGAVLKAERVELRDLRECAFKASDKDSRLEAAFSKVSGSGKGACVRDRARAAFADSEFFDNAKGFLLEDGASVSAERTNFMRNGELSISASGKSLLALTDSLVAKSKAVAVSLSGASEAKLERVKLQDNIGEGAALKEGSRLTGTGVSVLGNDSCGIIVQDAGTIVLSKAALNGNLCGIALYRGGKLEINDSDLTNNRKGPLLFKESFRSEIEIKGSGNIPKL